MNKSFDAVETIIERNDELYYWAMSYCKAHHCNVKSFYHDNKAEVDKKIDVLKKSYGVLLHAVC